MPKDSFSSEAMNDTNKHWAIAKKRESGIYPRQQDIRSDFARDYTRILHCTAYRRLKHKTQVFFATQNDHICTRIEHVNHVCSIAETIATYLGLNRELTAAISIGHDIGHAPFGHAGEHTLKEIAKKEGIQPFWHEKNSLRFADAIELLEGPKGKFCNLKLTYAVRDGIVCHCGELDENKGIRPRNDNVDLSNISEPGKLDPFTWEGCVVKLADKIAYLGRDIEDAISLKILSEEEREELINIACGIKAFRDGKINNTVLIHKFIIDLCEYSDLSSGVGFSSEYRKTMKKIKDFNYDKIYKHPRLKNYKKYAELVIISLFDVLKSCHSQYETLTNLNQLKDIYKILIKTFAQWLIKYSTLRKRKDLLNNFSWLDINISNYENTIVYDIKNEKEYSMAILDYISGMTDQFALKLYSELTTFS